MKKLYLGIDTSNYTTSMALCDEEGQLVADCRRVLKVRPGERGLRQSEAVFQHVQNLPVLARKLRAENRGTIAGICYSKSPRPQVESYMPVFRVGESHAEVLATMAHIPVVAMSHQENHIRSAIYGGGCTPETLHFPILATHFSGGTSELLKVTPEGKGYHCDIVGKTLDLNAGQLVDRLGVALGMDFPAGKALEALAKTATHHDVVLTSRVEGCDFHFAGQENQARALLEKGVPANEIADALFRCIGKTLHRVVRQAAKEEGIRDIVFSGGVMANGLIRETIAAHLIPAGLHLHFTQPHYATDNAVGCALLGWDCLKGEKSDD